MVSKANDDFPLPLMPVSTTSLFLGNETLMFLRLCSRAPMISMNSWPERSTFFCGDDDLDMEASLQEVQARKLQVFEKLSQLKFEFRVEQWRPNLTDFFADSIV